MASRKAEHVAVVTTRQVDSRTPAGWDDFRLVHQALPEIDPDEVDTSAEFLGRRLRYPLIVVSMTGGHPEAYTIYRTLALVAEASGSASWLRRRRPDPQVCAEQLRQAGPSSTT